MDKIGILLVICLVFTTFSDAKPQKMTKSGDSEVDETTSEISSEIFENNAENNDEIIVDNSSDILGETKIEEEDEATKEITAVEVLDENAAKKLVVNAIEKFRENFFAGVRNTSQNQIMSSYSLTSVLGMLLNGAGGDTAKQVLSSFGIVEEKKDIYIQNYKLVANQLKCTKNFKLNSANRLVYTRYLY